MAEKSNHKCTGLRSCFHGQYILRNIGVIMPTKSKLNFLSKNKDKWLFNWSKIFGSNTSVDQINLQKFWLVIVYNNNLSMQKLCMQIFFIKETVNITFVSICQTRILVVDLSSSLILKLPWTASSESTRFDMFIQGNNHIFASL